MSDKRTNPPAGVRLLWEDDTPGVQVDRVQVEPRVGGILVRLYHGTTVVNGGWVELWMTTATLRRLVAAHLASPGWRLGSL